MFGEKGLVFSKPDKVAIKVAMPHKSAYFLRSARARHVLKLSDVRDCVTLTNKSSSINGFLKVIVFLVKNGCCRERFNSVELWLAGVHTRRNEKPVERKH